MSIKPMLAKEGEKNIINNDSYIFEPKLDGIRCICLKSKDKIKLLSRNGIDITKKYPEFDFQKNIKAKNCILDGEIVVFDKKGNPSFSLWQRRNKGEDFEATYVVFDILAKDDKELIQVPLVKRKAILEKTIKKSKTIQTSFYTKDGKALWKIIKKRRLEGIIAKNKESTYEPDKRSDSWLKIKITKTLDCVILGFTVEKRALTSLALGLYEKNKLIFVGKVGTGFDEDMIRDLRKKLEKIKVIKTDVVDIEDSIILVKPKFIAEIKYHELTPDKRLRAPVFLRLRQDKKLKDCVL